MPGFERKRLLTWVATIAAAVLSSLAFPVVAPAQHPDLEKLHALLVIDTNVRDLRESITIDKDRMQHLLMRTIPASRYDLKVLTGSQVNERTILQYYRDLKTSKQDALLFYFAGHGAIDPKRGEHYFFLQEKTPLFRSTVRQAMLAKQAGLVVLCTDCCSNMMRVPTRTRSGPPDRAREMHPVMRSLFFQHRGLVDITAATDNSSWGDDDNGGLFTRTLDRVIRSDALEERARKGFLGWSEVFPLLQRETEHTFNRWARQQRARGESIDQSTQRPRAFHLPGGSSEDAREYAVVSIRNDRDRPISYQCRWSADAAWQSYTLPPRGTQLHSQLLSRNDRGLPQLEVIYGKSKKTKHLEAARITGSPGQEPAKKYHFGKGRTTRSLDDEDEGEKATHAEEQKTADPG